MPVITPQTATTLTPQQTATRGWISQLTWSPNGRLLACASAGGVAVWRGAISNSKPFFIKGHHGPVQGVAFAPNGATLATCSADTTVKVWDLRAFSPNMQPVDTYTDFQDAVEAVIFGQNNSVIACGADGTVRFFSAGGAAVVGDPAHGDEALTLALHHEQRVLASGGRDGQIMLWQLQGGTHLSTWGAHRDWVRAADFHPAKPLLATTSRDQSARLWDVTDPASPQLLHELIHRGDVRAVAFSADGDVLATGGLDGRIYLWDTATGEALGTLSEHSMPVVALAFHPGGALLASGGGDNRVVLWG